ncbi:MAG TPA: DUF4912 domain-containing protein [Planctomycetota bacterium]|nr:DUF4912 domain-containing protein [Planctomycetota bacterium]
MARDPDARKAELESQRRNQLLEIAKELGIKGRHLMSKHGLISGILKEEAAGAAQASPAARAPAAEEKREDELSKIEKAQEEAEQAKYELGPTAPEEFPLPRGKELAQDYGRDRLVLMVRDPYWAHAYWEVTQDAIDLAKSELGSEHDGSLSVLRIYELEGGETRLAFDIELAGSATNWYINLGKPGGSFCVDIGIRTPSGRFYTLVRSNSVTMPPIGMSNVIDEKWVSLQEEFERMYALSGGFAVGSSSAEMRELFEKRLQQEISSGALFSMMSPAYKERKRGFWLNVDVELIVYGATEPDAHVTVQGNTIKLRPDGTFTLRFAMPDGKQTIDVTAESADGKETRTITPEVERRTYRPEPVLAE